MRIQHFLSFFFCRIMKIYVKKIRNIMRLEKTINHQPCLSVANILSGFCVLTAAVFIFISCFEAFLPL